LSKLHPALESGVPQEPGEITREMRLRFRAEWRNRRDIAVRPSEDDRALRPDAERSVQLGRTRIECGGLAGVDKRPADLRSASSSCVTANETHRHALLPVQAKRGGQLRVHVGHLTPVRDCNDLDRACLPDPIRRRPERRGEHGRKLAETRNLAVDAKVTGEHDQLEAKVGRRHQVMNVVRPAVRRADNVP
jgi:hypothetical protein